MGEAERLNMAEDWVALTQVLATSAQNIRNYPHAEMLFSRLASHRGKTGDQKGEAAAYHTLGMIAEERRDFESAEQWYRKALAISEKLGDEPGVASTYPSHHPL